MTGEIERMYTFFLMEENPRKKKLQYLSLTAFETILQFVAWGQESVPDMWRDITQAPPSHLWRFVDACHLGLTV